INQRQDVQRPQANWWLKLKSSDVRPTVCSGLLCRYLLEREGGNLRTVACVFDREAADFAFSINIQKSVLVEVTSLRNLGSPKFDMQRIGVLKILNFHGSKDLSKKAL